MNELWSAIQTWTMWQWCAAWMSFWSAFTILVCAPQFNLALAARMLHQYDYKAPVIALARAFLLFAAWWIARFLTWYVAPIGTLHWVLSTLIMFALVAMMLKVLGSVTSKDLRRRRLTKEYILVVCAIVALSMIQRSQFSSRQRPRLSLAPKNLSFLKLASNRPLPTGSDLSPL
jgi:hypothetical protein